MAEIEITPIDKIVGSNPIFSKPDNSALNHSLDQNGIMAPVTLWQKDNGEKVLLDGFKRYSWAKIKKATALPSLILPMPPYDAALFLLSEHSADINDSVVAKAKFIETALKHGVTNGEAITLLEMIGLGASQSVLRDLSKVSSLPKNQLDYLDDKKYSLKQIRAVSVIPEEIRNSLFSIIDNFAFTASIFLEVAERINDHLRATDESIEYFLRSSAITALLSDESLAPKERTARLRKYLSDLRFPILNSVTERITKIEKELNLPENVNIIWDKTLERKEIKIVVTAAKPKQLESAFGLMSTNKEFQSNLSRILDEL